MRSPRGRGAGPLSPSSPSQGHYPVWAGAGAACETAWSGARARAASVSAQLWEGERSRTRDSRGWAHRTGAVGRLLTGHRVLAVCRGPPVDTLAPAEVPVQSRAERGQGEQDQQESQSHGRPGGLFSAWSGPSGHLGRDYGSRSWGSLARTDTSSWVASPTGHLSFCPRPTIASRPPSHQRHRGHRRGFQSWLLGL